MITHRALCWSKCAVRVLLLAARTLVNVINRERAANGPQLRGVSHQSNERWCDVFAGGRGPRSVFGDIPRCLLDQAQTIPERQVANGRKQVV